jgi:amidase
MSVPTHVGPDGSPIGVQLTARFGREDVLFNLAGELEQYLDRARRASF